MNYNHSLEKNNFISQSNILNLKLHVQDESNVTYLTLHEYNSHQHDNAFKQKTARSIKKVWWHRYSKNSAFRLNGWNQNFMNVRPAISNNFVTYTRKLKTKTKTAVSNTSVKNLNHNQRLKLAYQLHVSLDVIQIIDLFTQAINKVCTVDCVTYSNEEHSIQTYSGFNHTHYNYTLSYNLSLEKDYLGTLIFKRNKNFSKRETTVLENLLCLLLHPLKNALNYYQALQAALHDPLTGLFNRTALQQILHREIELAKRHHTPLSVLALDVDHFKKINDQYGHSAGDEILKMFSEQLSLCVRETDMIFRMGGEEFIILLSHTALKGAKQLAKRICSRIASHSCHFKNFEIQTSVSIGTALFEADDTMDTLLDKADKALYKAKENGRNQIWIYKESV